MGSLTEAFAFLREVHNVNIDFNDRYYHIEITPELKQLRRKLKLHKKEPIQCELF